MNCWCESSQKSQEQQEHFRIRSLTCTWALRTTKGLKQPTQARLRMLAMAGWGMTAPGVTPACPTAHSTLHSHHQWMVYEQIVFLYAQGNTNCHRFMETTELCSLLFSNHSVMLLSKLTDSSAQQSHRKYQGSRQCDRNKWCVSGCLSELERNSNKQKLFLLLPMNLSFLHASSCQALALIAICLPSVCQTNFTTTQTCL